ncbi:MAG: vitamin B12-dependent ribonucleotide reductase [Actinomycetota bacterium]
MSEHEEDLAAALGKPAANGLSVRRYFTTPGVHPYEELDWELRDAILVNFKDGSVAFEQRGVEFPTGWSQNATNIVTQKYFRGGFGLPDREHSVRQLIDRVAGTIRRWGVEGGYFATDADADCFHSELIHLLVNQKAAFNSPVWFNLGVEEQPQCSACFILHVDDTMNSILNWYVEEGLIFKGGSGAGVNLSTIRSSKERLSSGGEASGPVSFMRGADASAGTIRSGGKTRRAAKMVILNVDHPDVVEFIWCKAREERKMRALRDAGFDVDLDGRDLISVQYQNANNSVRVTEDFMRAVEQGGDWDLKAVKDGRVIQTLRARDLMRHIVEATWECADPGLQYDTTINAWHTCPESGRINASNPCSEYMHVDNSACNLASLNLLKFLDEGGNFDVSAFRQAVEIIFLAQEILISNSSYPTDKITENAKHFRQIGLGYANLGALLMAEGMPYDSEGGRAWAAALTALMTGHAYRTSARIAAAMGSFAGFGQNRDAMLRVIRKHRNALEVVNADLAPSNVLAGARQSWDEALALGEESGFRNSQATVLAPTGTIGFLLDCDTTGIEPDLALIKTKKLVGGGSMSIVNRTVPRALRRLGYEEEQIEAIIEYVAEHNSVVGAPALREEHCPVFDCAMGERSIHYMGHIRMMGAVQPFLSGAISKTVNMPNEATPEEIERAYIEGWRLGLKALAVYRDGSKVGQPLTADKKESAVPASLPRPVRRRLPMRRPAQTTSFRVGDCEGYITAGSYPDDGLGEIFLKVSKQGSTLSGVMDAFAIAVSVGLQYGVPLEAFVAKFTNMVFEPNGMTDDPDIRFTRSLVDYIFRRLALDHLPAESQHSLGIYSVSERTEMRNGVAATGEASHEAPAGPPGLGPSEAPRGGYRATTPTLPDAPYCYTCGVQMRPAGSCYVCESCGTTSGCS